MRILDGICREDLLNDFIKIENHVGTGVMRLDCFGSL